MRPTLAALAICLSLAPLASVAQQQVAFGGLKTNTKLPVEVTADSLSVNQTDGTATFTGNVLIVQGEMRLKAAQVDVTYGKTNTSKIDTLHATGGVTLVSATEAAESKVADYDVTAGKVVMTGDVLLTQGKNVMAGQKLTVDLTSGTGQMDGRVRTVLQPETKP